jgi:hypothetical protein
MSGGGRIIFDEEAGMPNLAAKLKVRLSTGEREELAKIARSGSVGAREAQRAKILLLVDEIHVEGRRSDAYAAEVVGVSERQVVRVRQAFVREGKAALSRRTRSDAGVPRKLDGDAQAQLATLCCSSPPAGRERWTLQLLCDELAKLEIVESVCVETVRTALKKTNSSLGEPNVSASPTTTGPPSSRRRRPFSTSTASDTTKSAR